MKIYHFYFDTKEFYKEENYKPVKGLGLPAHSTTKEPLEPKEGYAVVFDEENQEWFYSAELVEQNIKDAKINNLYAEYQVYHGLVEAKAATRKDKIYYNRIKKFFALYEAHKAMNRDLPKYPEYPISIIDRLKSKFKLIRN